MDAKLANKNLLQIMNNQKLLRATRNRQLCGVCAGLARYFGWETQTVRIIYAILTVFTAFSGVLLYIILLFLMPESDEF